MNSDIFEMDFGSISEVKLADKATSINISKEDLLNEINLLTEKNSRENQEWILASKEMSFTKVLGI